MIYRSNLTCPDLQPFFRHTHCRVMGHSQGHDVLSDFTDKSVEDPVFGIYKNCGFWTHDEAAILYNVARAIGGEWLDIGGLTGWTAAHEAAAGCRVTAVDTMYSVPDFRARAEENLTLAGNMKRWKIVDLGKGTTAPQPDEVTLWTGTSNEFFTRDLRTFDGIVIDGDHSPPCPLQDAINAATRIKPGGVILFHDAIGEPVKEGYRYLQGLGWKLRIYKTPHVVALCYQDPFVPPEHISDPRVRV